MWLVIKGRELAAQQAFKTTIEFLIDLLLLLAEPASSLESCGLCITFIVAPFVTASWRQTGNSWGKHWMVARERQYTPGRCYNSFSVIVAAEKQWWWEESLLRSVMRDDLANKVQFGGCFFSPSLCGRCPGVWISETCSSVT